MKVSKNWGLKKIRDEAILLPLGQAAYDLRGVINLNQTSVELFELLKEGKTEEDLVSYLLANYDVQEEVAKKDVREFIDKLKESKVLIDE